MVSIRNGRNLSMSCWEHDIIFEYCVKFCQSSPQFRTLKAVTAFPEIASNPRIAVTKRSKFFKITEVQTKASFELSLPRVPLFYPSARSREGTVWYTLLNMRGDFQEIFHWHWLVHFLHWTLILPPFPVIFPKSLKIIFLFFYIPLRVLENRVLRDYLGLRGTRLQGNGENYIMRSLMSCTAHPILFGW